MNPHGLAACGFEVLRGFSFWHSPRDVNRITDEKILPENFYSASVRRTRFFESHACVFICFYFESADRLTSEERLRAITTASHQFLKWNAKQDWSVQDEFLTIDLFPFSNSAGKQIEVSNHCSNPFEVSARWNALW